MSTVNDFRAAAGLTQWPAAAEDLAADDPPASPRGPGLFRIARANVETAVTNIRRLAGRERKPGSGFVSAATAALGLEAAGLLYVSFAAQYAYILSEKPGERTASLIEAGMLDGGQVILSFLALGLARQGKSARTERALIMVCAALSAVMNYAAAFASSWRSVLVYVLAPVFLAIITDRVIAVVRRHVLGDEETSAWSVLGRVLCTLARAAGLVLLYGLRFALAAPSTASGLRRMILLAAPVPAPERTASDAEQDQDDEADHDDEAEGPPKTASKKAKLTYWYERDAAYGDRKLAADAARRLAPKVDLSEGTARAYIGQILAGLPRAGEAS